jgi:large subunit ribosomal protein L24
MPLHPAPIRKYLGLDKPEVREQLRPDHAPIHLSKLRLVYALPHPETGALRDVIVSQIELIGSQRYIPGTDIRLPWPAKKPAEEEIEHPGDTPRIDVEKQTFVPVLLEAPLPTTVIDELRHKYSKFRKRHDDEYIAKKIAEDEAKDRFSPMRCFLRSGKLSTQTPVTTLYGNMRYLLGQPSYKSLGQIQ